MSEAGSIFKLVRESSNLSADDALLLVMEGGEPAVAQEAARTLLARERIGGLSGAVKRFHHFSDGVQQIIIEGVERMFPAVRQCVSSTSPQVCTNAISIISAGGNSRLAYLLSSCLVRSSRNVREAAGAGLAELGRRYFDREARVMSELRGASGAPAESPDQCYATITKLNEDRQYLTTALEQALENYDAHCRTEVLEASLRLADSMGKAVWTRASSPGSKLGRGMVEQLISRSEPEFAGMVCRTLTHAELRPPVVQMISRCRKTEFMLALADQSWLLGIPRIRKAFGFVHGLSWLNAGVDPLLQIEPERVAKVLRLVMATGMSADSKVGILRELLLTGKRPAQRAALWALLRIETDNATETLRSVLSWEDEELSPIALTELMRRQPEDLSRLMVRQLGSRSESVREVAEEEVASTAFNKYWQKFGELSVETRVEAARAMAKVVPDLPRRLRAKLRSSSRSDRLQAILIVRMLDLCEEMQDHLYELSHDADNTVKSAAIGALGQLANPVAERIAHQAVRDADARVQANAVEALDQMGSPKAEEALRDHLDSESNRIRANAVKALLKLHVREAAETLMNMLGNESHQQRISALWVIEQLGLATLLDHVVELSEIDPHPSVRARAVRIRGKLESHRTLAESSK